MSKEYLESLDYVWYNYYTEEELSEDEINEFVKHLKIVETALHRLEAIDNADPSEALEIVDKMANYILLDEEYGFIDDKEKQSIIKDRDTIKQALLKAQQPKQYLKWEDLEFGVPTTNDVTIKVKMGDTQYHLSLRTSFSDVKSVVLRDNDLKPILHLYEKEKQFFNDLKLERVEE